jgi:hypothetical protein
LHQPVDAAGIVTAPLQNKVSAAGIVSVPVSARYPVNRLGSAEGVPNVTGAPRIIGQDPSPDHITASQGAAYANAKAAGDTLRPEYLIPSPADVADEARQKRIADLRQKKRDLIAQELAIEAKIQGIGIQAAEADAECKAEVAAVEQSLQKSGGDAGAATGAVVGGVVGGPLGALAGAAVGATIGPTAAAAVAATIDLSGCKREVDLETQIPDLLKQASAIQAARADVDAAIAKALKEQADEARQQPYNAQIGNLAGSSRPEGATK